MVILDIHNLSFSYTNDKPVIENINFALHGGQLLALLGANGAGKSTLFRCVLGFEKTYSGTICMDGKDAKTITAPERAKLAAFVPQIHYPSFNYSVFDMVLMGTASQGREWSVPNDNQITNALAAMEQIGITHLKERDFRLISGGEQQLVLIARALAQIAPSQIAPSQIAPSQITPSQNPPSQSALTRAESTRVAPLLIMDEPASYLDYGNQLRVLFKIKELSKLGYGILLSTHNPDHAFLFADRIIALHDKHIAASGPPAECLTSELIEKLYGVKVAIRCDQNGVRSCNPTVGNGK
jgi:iron complex transport system ATP-binding protein